MEGSFPHQFSFNEAVSFVVECDDQQEIDYFWDNFTREGEENMCGWFLTNWICTQCGKEFIIPEKLEMDQQK